ncbi:MAG: SIR2 family protein [Armatimonadetes bacterium]|nr:SIR2 family protein [Armatimonadota bacterium]
MLQDYLREEKAADVDKFTNLIATELREGRGIVPLIGSGFSVHAGLPLISELLEYLQKCIALSLGLQKESDEEDYRWSPSTDEWPSFIDPKRAVKSGEWASQVEERVHVFSRILAIDKYDAKRSQIDSRDVKLTEIVEEHKWLDQERYWVKGNDNEGYFYDRRAISNDHKLFRQCLGAMVDFRTALQLITKLSVSPDRQATSILSAPGNPDIADSFWRHVLKGKKPGLGHKVLGSLAGALRTDLVLTTNYDTLLEEGYRAARNDLVPFSVVAGSQLPDCQAISGVRAIIKLHGERDSLLWDENLDVTPCADDIETFVTYFQDQYQLSPNQVSQKCSRSILVIGYSANDPRIVAFLRAALLCYDNLKIFWMAYNPPASEWDNPWNHIFPDSFANSLTEKKRGKLKDRLHVIHTRNPQYLLLDLHQRLRGSLPIAGCPFPSASRTTTAPFIPETDENSGYRLCEIDQKEVCSITEKFEESDKTLLILTAEKEKPLSSALSQAFRECQAKPHILPIRIDMNDVSSAGNLMEVLLESFSRALGVEDWTPGWSIRQQNISLRDDYFSYKETGNSEAKLKGLSEEFARFLTFTNKKWVIFLNCRETPGSNAGQLQWDLDETANFKTFSDAFLNAITFLLNSSQECGLSKPLQLVIASDGTTDSYAFDSSSFASQLRIDNSPTKFIGFERSHYAIDEPSFFPSVSLPYSTFCSETIINQSLNWAGLQREPDGVQEIYPEQASAKEIRFLYIITSIKRPRYRALFHFNDLFGEIDPAEIMAYLIELEKIGLVKRLTGGLYWIHTVVRDELWGLLSTYISKNTSLKIDCARIQLVVASWYEYLVDICQSPDAVFESCRHHLEAAAIHANTYQDEVIKEFKNAETVLKANMWILQTHGYSRGSCRQLDSLAERAEEIVRRSDHAKSQFIDSLRSFWLSCADAQRRIAREVGEDGKAYARHRLIGKLLSLSKEKLEYQLSLDHDELIKLLSKKDRDSFPKDSKLSLLWVTYCIVVSSSVANLSNAVKKSAFGRRPFLEFERLINNKRTMPQMIEFLRWRRWGVMLSTASRRYIPLPTQAQLSENLSEISFPWNILYHDGKSDLLEGKVDVNTPEAKLELLRTMLHAAEQLILMASARQKEAVQCASSSHELANEAIKLIHRANKLADRLRHETRSSLANALLEANWCQVRLLGLRAQALIILHPSILSGVFESLNLAESRLRLVEAQRIPAELALLDILRAHARITQGEKVFGDQFSNIWESSSTTSTFSSPQRQDVLSYAFDALRFLDRARPDLIERRRNVWWSSIYFEKRLRAMNLVLWATVDDGTTAAIPFFGFESVPQDGETEFEAVIKNATRMIRVDSYRLATIVSAYSGCLKALCVRFDRMRETPEGKDTSSLYRTRLLGMIDLLDDSIDYLFEVKDHRKHFQNSDNSLNEYAMLQKYIDGVINRCSVDLKNLRARLPKPNQK